MRSSIGSHTCLIRGPDSDIRRLRTSFGHFSDPSRTSPGPLPDTLPSPSRTPPGRLPDASRAPNSGQRPGHSSRGSLFFKKNTGPIRTYDGYKTISEPFKARPATVRQKQAATKHQVRSGSGHNMAALTTSKRPRPVTSEVATRTRPTTTTTNSS